MSTVTEKRNLTDEIQTAFRARGLSSDLIRSEALNAFLTKGFPGAKSEEYKFTPVTRELEKIFRLTAVGSATSEATTPPFIAALQCNVITFINGVYSSQASVILDHDIKVEVSQANSSPTDDDPFAHLNLAFCDQEVSISLPAGKVAAHPLAIVYHINAPDFVFANPRWRCSIGTSASLSLIEYTVCKTAPAFNNKHVQVFVGENAQLEHTVIQDCSFDLSVNNSTIHLANSAKAFCYAFTFDGQLVRNNLSLSLDGLGIDAHLYGLYLLSHKTIADNHTVVDHCQPNSFSNELYKGVMEENSKGIFNGKIYVRPHAQKTNAFQSNRNIILGDSATINTKPQLEIWADDVKCSHGCTTGQLDEEALFYLRSRGISKEQAKGIMLYAFASEVVLAIRNEKIRDFVDHLVSEKVRRNF